MRTLPELRDVFSATPAPSASPCGAAKTIEPGSVALPFVHVDEQADRIMRTNGVKSFVCFGGVMAIDSTILAMTAPRELQILRVCGAMTTRSCDCARGGRPAMAAHDRRLWPLRETLAEGQDATSLVRKRSPRCLDRRC
jgi:hypothetical protein